MASHDNSLTRRFRLATVFLLASHLCHADLGAQNATYGTRQLDQIICDRPELRQILQSNTAIAQWIVSTFDDRRIQWDGREPLSGRPAECYGETKQRPATVRVTARVTERRGEPLLKLFYLVFELHNLSESKTCSELRKMAYLGQIDENEFVTGMVQTEHRALVATMEFLKSHLTPPYDALSTWNKVPKEFEVYLRELDSQEDGKYDPRDGFRSEFRSYDSAFDDVPVEPTGRGPSRRLQQLPDEYGW